MSSFQKSILTTQVISGYGLHTGLKSNITFKKAPVNTGIQFIRVDLDNNPKIEANLINIDKTLRRTQLKKNNVIIQTTEHLLAAIKGLEIDNLYIEIDNSELPILDGSAKLYTDILIKAGIDIQKVKRKEFKIRDSIKFKDIETGSEYIIEPSDEFKIDIQIDYKSKLLGVSNAKLESINEFRNEISDARTFVFLQDILDSE